MANTYHQIYLQTVFAVKYRNAVLRKSWRSQLLGVIGNLIKEAGCKTIIVNGVEDHVHCFFGLKLVVSVSELMKAVKAKSSKYINDLSLTPARFEWQVACLTVGRGIVSFPIINRPLMPCTSTSRTKRSITKHRIFGMSIRAC